LDETPLDGDAHLFESQALDVPLDPRSQQCNVALQRTNLAIYGDLERDAAAAYLGSLNFGVGQEGDALAAQFLLELRRAPRIFQWQDLRHHLDDGYFGPKGIVEVCELEPDGTAADHQEGLGDFRQHHGLEVGDHALLVEGEPGYGAGPGAGG